MKTTLGQNLLADALFGAVAFTGCTYLGPQTPH